MADSETQNKDIVFLGSNRELFDSLVSVATRNGLEIRRVEDPTEMLTLPRRDVPGIILYQTDGTQEHLSRCRREGDGLPLFIPIADDAGIKLLENGQGGDIYDYLALPLNPMRAASTLRNAHRLVQSILTTRLLSQRVKVFHAQWVKLNQIGSALSTIHDLGDLLNFILRKCREITSADSGSLYLKETAPQAPGSTAPPAPILRFKVAQNDSKFIPFREWTMPASKEKVSGYVALEGEEILIDDVYRLPADSPFKFDSSFDRTSGYRTKSMLVVPMRNHKDEIIGVIQLINKKRQWTALLKTPQDAESRVIPFDRDDRELAKSLASQAGVAVENAKLLDDLKIAMGNLKIANDELKKAKQQIEDLFEGFVNTCARAVEARDNALSGHTDRMALYATVVARKINEVTEGPLAKFRFNEAEIKALKYAAILHDFGKIGVREEILWKASRLRPERLEAVAYRFEAFKGRLRDQTSRLAIQFILENRGATGTADYLLEQEARLAKECEALDRDLAFIQRISKLGYLSDEDLMALNRIRDKRLRVENQELALISEEEYEHLSVRKGNLTAREWVEMKKHVAFTYDILMAIPWEGELRMVPEIAGSHHEKRDGSGYHRGLTGDKIPIGGQILALVDIYEALTASDRPYKKQFSREEALKFLDECASTNWLNPDVVKLFVDHRLYETPLPDGARIPKPTTMT
ncbi:MAG: GAF domain-containing protein [Candidatus Riflebacteria bacterium]|nr:GAF domain-containing protein [Candidatus Riflebacteria bacterium]